MQEKPKLPTKEFLDSGDKPSYLIKSRGVTDAIFSRCWNAQTLEAYSESLGRTVWMLVPCNQWSCKQCSCHKIKALAARTNEAKPNRLLTLTIDPSLWENPRASFDGTRRQVPELFRRLRLKFGEVQYLRVTELTAKGWPHYHLLVRSPYIPHSVVKLFWSELTGATIVDLRQVKSKFQTYIYLVKYLSKMHNLGWTNRHVSTSRKFFPPQAEKEKDPYKLREKTLIQQRPGNYLYEMYRGASITEVAHNVYALTRKDEPDSVETRATLEDHTRGLPQDYPSTKKQGLLWQPSKSPSPLPTQDSASP